MTNLFARVGGAFLAGMATAGYRHPHGHARRASLPPSGFGAPGKGTPGRDLISGCREGCHRCVAES